MAKLELQLDTSDGKKAISSLEELAETAGKAEVTFDQLTDAQKRLVRIGARSAFSKMAQNAGLAEKAIKRAKINSEQLSDSLDKASASGNFSGIVAEAKSLIILESRINSELDKQARLMAKLAAETGTGTAVQSKAAAHLRTLKSQTAEIEKQANAEQILKKAVAQSQAASVKAARDRAVYEKRRAAYGKQVAAKLVAAERKAGLARIRAAKLAAAEADKVEKKRIAARNKIASAVGLGSVAGGVAGVTTAGIQLLTSAISRLTGMFVQMGVDGARSFYDINTRMEQLQILLNTATGSNAGGVKAFEDILEFSTKAPFNIDSLADSFVKLKTAGLDPMNGTLQTLIDSVAAFGGSSEQLRLVTIAIQQMTGKGVVSMEELRRQFGEQVPTAMRAMARGLGMTMLDMVDLISKGGLEAQKGITAMITELEKLHGGAAVKRMASMEGATTRLQNVWTRLILDLGKGNGSFSALKDVVNSAAAALDAFRTSTEGKQIMDELSASMTGFFDKIKDPAVMRSFFEMAVSGFKLAVNMAEMLYDIVSKIFYILDKLSKIDFGKSLALTTTPGKLLYGLEAIYNKFASINGEGVKPEVEIDITPISDFETKYNKFLATTKGVDITPKIDVGSTLSSLEQVEAKLRENSANWSGMADEATKAYEKAGEALDKFTNKYTSSMDRLKGEDFTMEVSLMSDENANTALLARAKELESLAKSAGESGADGWKRQVELLEQARKVYRQINITSKKVSAQEVSAAKKKLDYQMRITRGGQNAYGDAAKDYNKAWAEYLRLKKAYNTGGSDQKAEKSALESKLALMKQNTADIQAAMSGHVDDLANAKAAARDVADTYNDAASNVENFVTDSDKKVSKFHAEWMDDIEKTNSKYKDLIDTINKIPSVPSTSTSSTPARALGGPVTAGTEYMVGERGVEMFTPRVSGYITPNNKLDKSTEKMVDINFSFGGASVPLKGSQTSVDEIHRQQKIKARYAA